MLLLRRRFVGRVAGRRGLVRTRARMGLMAVVVDAGGEGRGRILGVEIGI